MAIEQFKQQKNRMPVILFRAGDEEFAINLLDAKEIIQAGQIRRLPQCHEYLEGVYNYRGNIIHIISLKKKLRISEQWHYQVKKNVKNDKNEVNNYFIIATVNGQDMGFVVDDVINISYVSPESIEDINPIIQTNIDIEYIKGIVKLKDKPRILLDLATIVSETEQRGMKDQVIDIPVTNSIQR